MYSRTVTKGMGCSTTYALCTEASRRTRLEYETITLEETDIGEGDEYITAQIRIRDADDATYRFPLESVRESGERDAFARSGNDAVHGHRLPEECRGC